MAVLASGVIYGVTPKTIGQAEVTPHDGESITHVINRGVAETGVETVDSVAVADAAQEVSEMAPGYVNPEQALEISVTQSPLQGVFNAETVRVAVPSQNH